MVLVNIEWSSFWLLLERKYLARGSEIDEGQIRQLDHASSDNDPMIYNVAALIPFYSFNLFLGHLSKSFTLYASSELPGPRNTFPFLYFIKQACHWQACFSKSIDQKLLLVPSCTFDLWCAPLSVLASLETAIIKSARTTLCGWTVFTLSARCFTLFINETQRGPYLPSSSILLLQVLAERIPKNIWSRLVPLANEIVLDKFSKSMAINILRRWTGIKAIPMALRSPILECELQNIIHSDQEELLCPQSKTNSSHTIRLELSCHDCSFLIGRRGSRIKSIRLYSKCVIRIERNTNSNLLSRKVTPQSIILKGSISNLQVAIKAIRQCFASRSCE